MVLPSAANECSGTTRHHQLGRLHFIQLAAQNLPVSLQQTEVEELLVTCLRM